MASRIPRRRIRPMWRAGVRPGTPRDTMSDYIAAHPGYLEDLFRIDEELRAIGFVPMSMHRVKQPFDYERR